MFNILSLFYRFIWRITKVSKSFSSDGEDLIIEKIFHGKTKGTYVDIGAYAPISYNNTFLFYLKGWNGVLIDPRPRFKFWAKMIRSKDEVFNIGLDPKLDNQLLTKKLYVYDSYPDNNTISEDRVAKNLEVLGRKHSDEIDVNFAGFEYIMKNSDTLKIKKELDFLSIDIEGIEYEVIKSIICDKKVLPNVVCIEQLSMDCKHVLESEIYKLLSNNGYALISRTILSSIYVHEKFIKNSKSPYFDTRLRSQKN